MEKPKESPVNRLNKEEGNQTAKECYRCGGKFHEAENAGTRMKSVIDARRKTTRRLSVASN